jgi:PAS domain S-box-containing protein
MKIKTQFRMTMFLFGSVVTAALALIIITDNQAERTIQQEELAVGIAQRANELSYLANDYLIYREDQHISRWQSRFDLLLKQTAGLNVDTPEEQMLVRNINENSRRLKETFDGVLSAVPNFPKDRSGDLNLEFLKISSSRLAVQTQGLFSDAQRLSHLIHDRRKMLRGTRTMLIYILLGLFGLFLFTNYILTYRRMTGSMATLQSGAKIIGSGDLDYEIKKERDDEIGELSDAFNQMTAGLKIVTASKNDLEKEMEERKRAEIAMQASEERLRFALESCQIGAWDIDLEDHTAYRSLEHDRIFGYQELRPSWTLDDFLKHALQEYRMPVKEMVLEATAKKTGWTYECQIRRADGEVRWIWFSGQHRTDSSGHSRVAGVVQDITERRKAEDEINRSKKTFVELVERAPFGIYTVDSQFRIAQMNIGSQTGAFRNVRPVIGRDFAETMRILWPEPVAGEIIAKFRNTLDTGEPYYSPRFVNPRHDVEFIESYEWELHRVMLPDGEYGVICYYFDSTKLREAEKALRQSEERLRLALTAANLGTWDYSSVTGALVWDARCKELFGLPPEAEVDYDTFLAGLHPEDRDRANEVVQHTFDPAGDGLFDIEYRTVGLRDGGMLRWIRATGRASFSSAGQATRFTGTVQDITEHKHAEEALRESELQFRMALRNAPVSVAAQDLDLRYIWAFNQRTAQPDQIIGHFDDEIFTPDEAAHVTAIKRRVIEEDVELREQMWFNRPVGRIFLDVCWEPIHDEAGRVTGVASATVDLTQIKLAEEALRESEQKYRNLFENMAEEVHFWKIIRDEEGRIKTWQLVDANPPTLKSWGGRTAEEIRGKTTDEIFGPGATEHYMPVILKIMNEGIPYSFEDYFPNLDKHFRFTSVPLGDYFITTGADITVIKKAEDALKASLREKEVLLKEIHHRVKNNMQVISSLVALQADQLQDAGMRAILDEMAQRVRSMAMVHEKLYQSHDLAGVEFSDYARSLLNYLWRSHATAASAVRLTLDLEPVSLTVNTAVPCGLILNELVSNALKHAFRGRNTGEVTVSLHSATGGIRLSVRDDGTGLPAGFDWKQATSLGLRLVQMLAGQLHADVEVSSDRGTEFTITFGEPKT